MKSLLKLSALALVAAFGSSAYAATPATANFQATATLTSSCTIAATAVAFGTFTPTLASVDLPATGTITSTCSNNVPYVLNLNAGNSFSYTNRALRGATSGNTDAVIYNLYTEAAHTNIFGNVSDSFTKNVSLTGTGSLQTTTVYGNLNTHQFVTPDTYSDNITVTLAY